MSAVWKDSGEEQSVGPDIRGGEVSKMLDGIFEKIARPILVVHGEKLRKQRIALGISLRELSDASGITKSWLSIIERGGTRRVTVRFATAITLAFETLSKRFSVPRTIEKER